MGTFSSKSSSKKEGASAVCGGSATKSMSQNPYPQTAAAPILPKNAAGVTSGAPGAPGPSATLSGGTAPVLVQPVLAGGAFSGHALNPGPPPTPYLDTREGDVRAVGLDNFGNTCYCNSVVQLLYHCSALRTRLLQLYEEHFSKKPSDDTLLYRLVDLIHQMHMARRSMKKDDSACSKLQSFVKRYKAANELFDNRQQHDAHEFAIFILSTVIDDEKALLNIPKNRRGPIQEIFEGQLRTSTYCLDCETKAERRQPFLDVNLQIEPHASLVNSITSFMAPEFFSADNKVYCEACCAHVCAKQMHGMKKVPRDAMIVHLKRFEFSERDHSMRKLSFYVPLPDTIGLDTQDTLGGVGSGGGSKRVNANGNHDRREASEQQAVFRLKGFVVHQGAGVNVGHYVGCFRTKESWRKYDDDLVSYITERDLQQYYGEPRADDSMLTVALTAYILLYEREY